MTMTNPDAPIQPPRLILASASPRRRELMALLGLPYAIVTSDFEEPPLPEHPVSLSALVTSLARGKAEAEARRSEAGSLVLGADTIVSLSEEDQGIPLGKPKDGEDAKRMLRLLSGATHSVFTGVALARAAGPNAPMETLTDFAQTFARFRELTEEMIAGYVATGEPLDKAGAYGAQGYAAPFITGFVGDYFNVVGLPVCTVGRLLEQAGVRWWQWRTEMPPVIG